MAEGSYEPYVDVKSALDRIRGNTQLYKKLLATFLANNQFDQLKQEVASGDGEAAAKTAHAIKGMAGNMSFTALMECVIALEGELKGGQDAAATFSKCEGVFEKTVECAKSLMETL